MQAIGDGGQGWGNALLYIFLSPVIRHELFCFSFFKCVNYVGKKMRAVGEKMETAGELEQQNVIIEQDTHPPTGSGRNKRHPEWQESTRKGDYTSTQSSSTEMDGMSSPLHQLSSASLLKNKDSLPETIEEESVEIRSRDSLSSTAAKRQYIHSNKHVQV